MESCTERIFSDADIITIYYGINDSHNYIPIGDIDDMVPTTFYGAFNVALDYLTRLRITLKRPNRLQSSGSFRT